jgi:hypothetical protein
MENYLNSLQQLINQCNWPACLVLSLTLPDICANHATNYQGGSQARYSQWFKEYTLHNYRHEIGADHEVHIFLSGDDFYALRCSLLHEGGTSISHQRARDVLDDFEFVTPPLSGGSRHNNQSNNKLQLQIDIFSQEILDACTNWWSGLSLSQQNSINSKLLTIHQI